VTMDHCSPGCRIPPSHHRVCGRRVQRRADARGWMCRAIGLALEPQPAHPPHWWQWQQGHLTRNQGAQSRQWKAWCDRVSAFNVRSCCTRKCRTVAWKKVDLHGGRRNHNMHVNSKQVERLAVQRMSAQHVLPCTRPASCVLSGSVSTIEHTYTLAHTLDVRRAALTPLHTSEATLKAHAALGDNRISSRPSVPGCPGHECHWPLPRWHWPVLIRVYYLTGQGRDPKI
jgi:hypothetical protein